MRKAFGLLARMKGLRGTALDIFGNTEERRTERALIVEYRACIDELLERLSSDNLALAVEIARIPEEIRGYGHVKARHPTGRPTVHTLVNMIMMQLEMAQGAQEPQVPHGTPDAPTPPGMPHADGT
eukprot:gene23326-29537_t